MRTNLQRGSSALEGLLVVVILGFIIISFVIPGKSPRPLINSGSDNYNYNSTSNYPYNNTDLEKTSSYSRSISIGSGNASRAYQPYEEYVTIDNRSGQSVNITGWTVRNAKDERTYELGGSLRSFAADSVRIPGASLYVSPNGISPIRDVILSNGETAVITTGSMGQQSPYKITSFKENICSGYLDASSDYTFTPPLTRNCPRPINEPGVSGLDTKCKEFINRMQSCHTPEFKNTDRNGDYCSNCVDGVQLSSSCTAFIKERYNYQGCIAYHAGDPNFSLRTWRIFLGSGWELWANDHDVIKLFDNLGNLVDYKGY